KPPKDGEAPRASAPRSRRTPKVPVIEIGQAKAKADALAGLERWKAAHPAAAAHLAPEDVLVDTMRGRSSAYYRVRVNLKNVPPDERPAQAAPDPDYDPAVEWRHLAERPADDAAAEPEAAVEPAVEAAVDPGPTPEGDGAP
ncbi:MAG TPA: hypothetical protein VHE35_28175, partial [Kofleriaceae bacterium]|nr:hypothetical protein [Kofleriaceae bacterium]